MVYKDSKCEVRYLEMLTMTYTERDHEKKNAAWNVRQLGIYIFKDQ